MRFRSLIVDAVGLCLLPWVFAGAAGQQEDRAIVQNTPADKFQKIPNLPDCITAAVVQGNPGNGASVLVVKGTASCQAPWHFHTPNEQLMMISGMGRVEMKGEQAVELRPGGFAYAPAKHIHQFTCVGRPCSFFLRSDAPFDIHYVDKDGNEVPAEQALAKQHKRG